MDLQGEVDKAFGNQMAETRRRRGMSQRDLIDRLAARGLRLDVPAVSRIETGTRAVRLWEAMTIVSVLDMTLDDLVPRSDVEEAFAMNTRASDEITAGVEQTARGIGLALLAWDLLEQEKVTLPPAVEGGATPTDRAGYLRWILELMEQQWSGPFIGLMSKPDSGVSDAVVEFFEAVGRLITTPPVR